MNAQQNTTKVLKTEMVGGFIGTVSEKADGTFVSTLSHVDDPEEAVNEFETYNGALAHMLGTLLFIAQTAVKK